MKSTHFLQQLEQCCFEFVRTLKIIILKHRETSEMTQQNKATEEKSLHSGDYGMKHFEILGKDMDDVFDDVEDLQAGIEGRLYDVMTYMANDMSRDIVRASLSSLTPEKGNQTESAHLVIPLNDDDYDEDKHLCQNILEDWEPETIETETSDSGSYVIGSSENVGQAQTRISSDISYPADDNDPLLNHDWIVGVEEFSTFTPPHHTNYHGNVEMPQTDDKHKMATQRLIDLIFGNEPFKNSIDTNPTDKKLPSIKLGLKENSKTKVKQWSLRLDRLLKKFQTTNWKFVHEFCEPRGSTVFNDFNCSEDEEDDEEDDEDGDEEWKLKPAVEFNRGLHCTDVEQARDILTTRYKLSDVNMKRSLISWSKWNVAHIVRGPHAQSPIWKPGFTEEVEKSKNLMEELNRSIDAREVSLQKLADNQATHYYKGMSLRCFERQQSNPNLNQEKQLKVLKSDLKANENNDSKCFRQENENIQKKMIVQSEVRSNSLSNLYSSPPHQPQQSDHIKCFDYKDSKTIPSPSRPSIMEFLKQTNQNDDLNKLKSHSISSKVSDEGYDDDVFYREDEHPGRKMPEDGQTHSRSHPFLNYFSNSQSLQAVSQQHRNKMKKRSQQRRRQIKKKLEISFPKQDIQKKSASSQQNSPTQAMKSFKETFNCMSRPGETKFNSLRINKKPPYHQEHHPTTKIQNPQLAKAEGTSVFCKLYHWFHGKVSGREF